MIARTHKQTIGRAERITFIGADIKDVPAKIDTGAYRSSVWASNIREKQGTLYFTLLGPDSSYYSGKELSTKEYKLIEVENSFGQKEERYSIFLSVRLGGRRVRSNFTLANRGMKTYPALIGRKMLKNRFVVDVSQGNPITDEEQPNTETLE